MSNTNTASVNGRTPRKTLADQLDRLDTIIDVLSDGLNETVADVVKQAVTVAVSQAVEASLQAILGNPELLAAVATRLMPPVPVAPPVIVPEKSPGRWQRIREGLKKGWQKVKTGVQATCAFVGDKVTSFRKRTWQKLTAIWQFGRQFRGPVAIAAGVGLVVGVGTYFAGPAIAALVSGLASSGLTFAGRILQPFWQMLVPASPVEQV